MIEQEYKNLVELEIRDSLKPAESAALLLKRLQELGFSDYSAFLATALGKEVQARNEQMGCDLDRTIVHFNELMQSAQSLLKRADEIFVAYGKNEYVPLNLQIQAAQLGEHGSTIGVISNNYNIISGEIRSSLNEFIASAKTVLKTINDGMFMVCTAKIQKEVVDVFSGESVVESVSKDTEMGYLTQQQSAYQKKAADGLAMIVKQAARFRQDCNEMKRLSAGLEVTRVMGKVESARIEGENSGLTELIGDLEGFQSSVSDCLREINHMNQHIEYNTRKLLELVSA